MSRGESGKGNDEITRPQYSCEQELGYGPIASDAKSENAASELSHQLEAWPPSPTEYEKWRSIPDDA